MHQLTVETLDSSVPHFPHTWDFICRRSPSIAHFPGPTATNPPNPPTPIQLTVTLARLIPGCVISRMFLSSSSDLTRSSCCLGLDVECRRSLQGRPTPGGAGAVTRYVSMVAEVCHRFFFPRACHPLAPPLPLPPLSLHLPTFGSLLARVTSRGGGPRGLSSERARHGRRIG